MSRCVRRSQKSHIHTVKEPCLHGCAAWDCCFGRAHTHAYIQRVCARACRCVMHTPVCAARTLPDGDQATACTGRNNTRTPCQVQYADTHVFPLHRVCAYTAQDCEHLFHMVFLWRDEIFLSRHRLLHASYSLTAPGNRAILAHTPARFVTTRSYNCLTVS